MGISINGKIAVVTGASRGIGEGIAQVFASEGAMVVCAARSTEDGEKVVGSINDNGGRAEFFQADIREADECQALVEYVADTHGRLDIMCHNAGIYPDLLMEEMPIDTWDDTINTNLRSCFLLTKPCIPIMRKQQWGRILFTSSITGPDVAQARLAAYSSSKGGVNAFIKAASLELAKDGITVNAVSPGNILTERRDASEQVVDQEPMINVEDISEVALLMATLPDQVEMLEATVLPHRQLYVGRG